MTTNTLSTPFPVDADIVKGFTENGHACIRGLLPNDEAKQWGTVIEPLARQLAWDTRPIEERDTYGKAFLQTFNLWEQSDEVRAFSLSKRFASVAAALLGVDGVRMYHDQALCKEPGGGSTPWHQDQNYWPIDGPRTVTMWMPLVDVPAEVGSMSFVSGTQRMGDLAGGSISDESEASMSQLIEDRGWEPKTYGAVAAGDATFHAGWTLHSAGANPTELFRTVMTVIYVDADAKVTDTISKNQELDHQIWLSGAPAGGPIDGPKNPVLWRASD